MPETLRADGAVEVAEVERGGVVGDGGAEHGYLGGGAGGGLERPGGVGEYQVDALGDEAVDYRGAAVLLSERVPLGKSDAVLAEDLDERVLKAARGLAEGDVFHLFADADGIAVEGRRASPEPQAARVSVSVAASAAESSFLCILVSSRLKYCCIASKKAAKIHPHPEWRGAIEAIHPSAHAVIQGVERSRGQCFMRR